MEIFGRCKTIADSRVLEDGSENPEVNNKNFQIKISFLEIYMGKVLLMPIYTVHGEGASHA